MNVGRTKLANIGPRETRKRLLMGVAMLAMGVVLAIIFTHVGVNRWWYSVLFLPFWMGTLPVSEARKKT
jgi:type IV secretory pathway VirB3-like protein